MNPLNTVFDAKRLIGRKFSDAAVQDDMKHFSFTVKARRGARGRDGFARCACACVSVFVCVLVWACAALVRCVAGQLDL
jgi:hypothetical protein